MKPLDLSDISMSQISAFLSVAKTNNMTRSADELHISQSAISRRISTLEEQAGLILFLRSNKMLRLTPAGKQLYYELKDSFASMESAFSNAFSVQEARRRVLNINMTSFFSIQLLIQILDRYREMHPEVAVNLTNFSWLETVPHILSESIDISLLYKSAVRNQPSIGFHSLLSWQYYALFHKDSELGRKEHLTLDDVLDEPQAAPSPRADATYVEDIAAFYQRHGKEPKLLSCPVDVPLIYSVLANKLMVIGSPSFCDIWGDRAYIRSQLRAFKLDDFHMELGLVWSLDREDKYIRDFIKTVDYVLDEGNNRELFDMHINGEPLAK